MNKMELVKSVSVEVGLTQADVERTINSATNLISEAIQHDGRCEIGGFGTFTKVKRAACSRPNPQDRTKMVDTPARNTVKFKPCPKLKAAVQ